LELAIVYHCRDAASTIAQGRKLSRRLRPGDVVAFYGDLGAGKTTMIKGVCAGLGVTEVVKSPSFVIVTEYVGTGQQTNHKDMKTQRSGDGQVNHRDTETPETGNREPATRDRAEPPRPPSSGQPRTPSPKPKTEGQLSVYHIDLYRIGKSGTVPDSGAERRGLSQDFAELEGIDFEGYLEAGGICLIEWAERAESLLPRRTIRVRLSLEGQGRRIGIEEPETPQKSEAG